LDLRILFATVFYVLGDPLSLIQRLHLVPRPEMVESNPPEILHLPGRVRLSA
jgi:hypothetical protein